MRYFALLLVPVFLWFAWLQLNDPDRFLWISIYLIPAIISFRAFQGKFYPEITGILSFVYFCYAIYLFMEIKHWEGFFTKGQGMEMKSYDQELARESAGLGICVLTYMIYLAYFFVVKKKVLNRNEALPG